MTLVTGEVSGIHTGKFGTSKQALARRKRRIESTIHRLRRPTCRFFFLSSSRRWLARPNSVFFILFSILDKDGNVKDLPQWSLSHIPLLVFKLQLYRSEPVAFERLMLKFCVVGVQILRVEATGPGGCFV